MAVGAARCHRVVPAAYYLRIVYYMYFGNEIEPVHSRISGAAYAMLVASAVAVVLGSITMFGIDDAAGRAAESLMLIDGRPAGDTVQAVNVQID